MRHKRTHTVVAVDEAGRQLGVRVTEATSTAEHLELVRWAGRSGPVRRWAVEDCRHLSRRLERGLLAAGGQIVRVPPASSGGPGSWNCRCPRRWAGWWRWRCGPWHSGAWDRSLRRFARLLVPS